jgi:hypothetical protein
MGTTAQESALYYSQKELVPHEDISLCFQEKVTQVLTRLQLFLTYFISNSNSPADLVHPSEDLVMLL